MNVFINAGHYKDDPGARGRGHMESKMAMELRDKLRAALGEKNVLYVPDSLNLRQSIGWINQRATKDDFAFSVHFNTHSNRFVRGTETFYHNHRERTHAGIFARHVALALGIPNRGAKPDTLTWIGRLGWVRNLKCDSVLVEVCFLTNAKDMDLYSVLGASRGIGDALRESTGAKPSIETEQKEQLEALRRQVAALRAFVYKLVARLLA